MKKWLSLLLAAPLMFTGCAGEKEAVATQDEIGGVLKVLTSRTDADELFAKIEADFIAKYPSVTDIIWENSADYAESITTRMNTTDYGDVLFIPFSMSANRSVYPNYFESLGSVEEMGSKYLDVTEADFDGQVYGLPTAINVLGMIYNTEVFKAAGITEMPTSTEEFLAVCEKIKSTTEAVPFFTNYGPGMGIWGGTLSSFGGENYKAEMLEAGTALKEGQPIREVLDLIYDLASKGYIEEDPMTLESARGQQKIVNGEIAMMMRGSQDANEMRQMAGSDEAIGMFPLPVQLDGKSSVAIGAPEVIGVSKHSENKETAKAFVEFFVSAASGYAADLGGMTPFIADLNEADKALVTENQTVLTAPPTDPEVDAMYSTIAKEVGIARLTDAIQKVINIGLYPEQNESYEAYIQSLETKWEQVAKENGK